MATRISATDDNKRAPRCTSHNPCCRSATTPTPARPHPPYAREHRPRPVGAPLRGGHPRFVAAPPRATAVEPRLGRSLRRRRRRPIVQLAALAQCAAEGVEARVPHVRARGREEEAVGRARAAAPPPRRDRAENSPGGGGGGGGPPGRQSAAYPREAGRAAYAATARAEGRSTRAAPASAMARAFFGCAFTQAKVVERRRDGHVAVGLPPLARAPSPA